MKPTREQIPFDENTLVARAIDMYGMIDVEQMYRTIKAMREINMSPYNELPQPIFTGSLKDEFFQRDHHSVCDNCSGRGHVYGFLTFDTIIRPKLKCEECSGKGFMDRTNQKSETTLEKLCDKITDENKPDHVWDGSDQDGLSALKILSCHVKPDDVLGQNMIETIRKALNRPAVPECPVCDGSGITTTIEPDCCGNTDWECKGHCAVPKEVPKQCDNCMGCGKLNELRDHMNNVENSCGFLTTNIQVLRHKLSQQHNKPAVPDGYALVPLEPTETMENETYGNGKCSSSWCSCDVKKIYRAMLAAALSVVPTQRDVDEIAPKLGD